MVRMSWVLTLSYLQGLFTLTSVTSPIVLLLATPVCLLVCCVYSLDSGVSKWLPKWDLTSLQSGNKRTLICLLLMSASQRVVGGTALWKDIFSPDFAAWVSDPVTIAIQTDADLHMFRPAPTRCASAIGAGDEREPSFSVNEFARLCAILYCDNTVRSSLIRSGLNLTRAQLDRGETRDEFWETDVSPRFNDCNCRPELELRGVLSGVDITLPGAHFR
jgi:hypothetical protein